MYLATIKDSPLRSIWNMHAKCLEFFLIIATVKNMGRDRQWHKLITGKNVNLDSISVKFGIPGKKMIP